MALDAKDKKILKELILNSRIPITRLAKKAGVSREVALYRLNRLKKDCITRFYTLIDTERLGLNKHTCFIQLKGITKQQEDIFIQKLGNNNHVTFMGPVIGKWNVVFDILSSDDKHLAGIIERMKKDQKVEKLVIGGVISAHESFPTKIIGINSQSKRLKHNEHNVDDIDLKILSFIADDSRIEYTDMAEKMEMTANAVRYRIKALEQAGIIRGYTISLDLRKLGLEWFNVQIKIDDSSLTSFLKAHPKALYYYRYVGNQNWDIDVGLAVKDSLELREFILDLRKNFPHTEIYDIYPIIEELKGDHPSPVLLRRL